MKKNKLYYLLFIILLMFSFTSGVKASTLKFKAKDFDGLSFGLQDIALNACSEDFKCTFYSDESYSKVIQSDITVPDRAEQYAVNAKSMKIDYSDDKANDLKSRLGNECTEKATKKISDLKKICGTKNLVNDVNDSATCKTSNNCYGFYGSTYGSDMATILNLCNSYGKYSAKCYYGMNKESKQTNNLIGPFTSSDKMPTPEDIYYLQIHIESGSPNGKLGESTYNSLCSKYTSKNTSIYKMCQKDWSKGDSTQTNNQCTYQFAVYKNGKPDTTNSVGFQIIPGNKAFNVNSNEGTELATDESGRGELYFYKQNVYLYSKNSTDTSIFWNQFSNNSCPSLTFCSNGKGSTKWYFESSDTSCSSYGGYKQTLENGAGEAKVSDESTNYTMGPWFGDTYEKLSCEELIGDELKGYIQQIVNIIKIVVPILLIVLGTIDFGKAIFVNDEGEMKKSQTKFIKRLIIAVAFFLVPTLLTLILNIAHNIWPSIEASLCGITF